MILIVPNFTDSKVLDCVLPTHQKLSALFVDAEVSQDTSAVHGDRVIVPFAKYASPKLEQVLREANTAFFEKEKLRRVVATLSCNAVKDSDSSFPFYLQPKHYKSYEQMLEDAPKKLKALLVDEALSVTLEEFLKGLQEAVPAEQAVLYGCYREEVSLGDGEEKCKRKIFNLFIADQAPQEKPQCGITVNLIFEVK